MDPTVEQESVEQLLNRLRKLGAILPADGPVEKDPVSVTGWKPPESYGKEGLGPVPEDPSGFTPPDFSAPKDTDPAPSRYANPDRTHPYLPMQDREPYPTGYVPPAEFGDNVNLAKNGLPLPGLTPEPLPESDKPLGTAPAAPTDIPVVEPLPLPPPPQKNAPAGQPEPQAGTPAQPSPGLDKYRRDPTEIIREAYRPAINDILKARQKDLARQTGLLTQAHAHTLIGAGIGTFNPALAVQGAQMLQKSAYDPVHLKLLEDEGKAKEALGKGESAFQSFDPNSDKSKGAVLALHSSSTFDDVAKRISANEGIPEQEARKMLYEKTMGMSEAGITAFMDTMKKSQDTSLVGVNAAYTDAQRQSEIQRANLLRVELTNAETLSNAFRDGNSAISENARATLRPFMSPQMLRDNPNFNKMSALELKQAFPQVWEKHAEMMIWKTKFSIDVAEAILVNDNISVARQPVTMPDGSTIHVPNQIGVAGKAMQLGKEQAAVTATESANRIQWFQTTGPKIMAQSDEGVKLLSDLRTFARAAATVIPGAGNLESQIDDSVKQSGGQIVPSALIFGLGGKKQSIAQVVDEVHKQLVASTQGIYIHRDTDVMFEPPVKPPFYMPSVKKKVENTQGYVFQIGSKKYVYWQKFGENAWNHEEIK